MTERAFKIDFRVFWNAKHIMWQHTMCILNYAKPCTIICIYSFRSGCQPPPSMDETVEFIHAHTHTSAAAAAAGILLSSLCSGSGAQAANSKCQRKRQPRRTLTLALTRSMSSVTYLNYFPVSHTRTHAHSRTNTDAHDCAFQLVCNSPCSGSQSDYT